MEAVQSAIKSIVTYQTVEVKSLQNLIKDLQVKGNFRILFIINPKHSQSNGFAERSIQTIKKKV